MLALANNSNDALALKQLDIQSDELLKLRQALSDTQGDLIIMFDGRLSAAAQTVIAQLPQTLRGEGRRVLLHPLPIYNNSVGAHDMGMSNGSTTRDRNAR